ncbi:hypothetical protein [Streptomyces goshikiensis]|uniref:hypothetical protein n=1 Tax=Streptomyces goshikiensis TaxID=1942 RepID=UPI0033B295F6
MTGHTENGPTLTAMMARTYPHEFELMKKVHETVSLHDKVCDRPVLAVTLTNTGESVAPAVVVGIDELLMKIRHDDPALEGREANNPIDHLLDCVYEDIRGRTGVAVSVIALPAPVQQVAPSDTAHCGGGPGTFGARVKTLQIPRALLTAGHAAQTTAAPVYDNSAQKLGSVASTRHCGITPALQVTSDVALIELDPATPDTLRGTPAPTVPGTGHRWDQVSAYGAVTSGQWSALLTAGGPFANPLGPTYGDWGQVMITAYPISAPGDSGAPVYNKQDELIGHIVGGNPILYSIVQDVNYQLQEAGATLR